MSLINVLDLATEVRKMHIRKRYYFDSSIEVEEYHRGKNGAPGLPREKRKKPTKEQMEIVNQKNREKKTRRLIKWNFRENDYWITLTYKREKRPESMEKAKKDLERFREKLRKIWKKENAELKWIATIEIGSKGGVHVHMIINRIQDGDVEIQKAWTHGRAHIDLMYEDGGFQALAEYIVKRRPGENKYYGRSRNLIEKQPETQRMRRSTLGKDPKPPKGYYLDKNTFYEGINPVTGFPYRSYTFVKIEKRRE